MINNEITTNKGMESAQKGNEEREQANDRSAREHQIIRQRKHSSEKTSTKMAFQGCHTVLHLSLVQLQLAIAVILVLMVMAERFAFPAIRSLLLTEEVTVLLQVMPEEARYGLWLFS